MDAAPAVGLNAAPLSYFEKQGPAKIDPTLTVSADANTQLASATVRLLGYQNGEDVLAVAAPDGLASWWDPTRGVLTLAGAAPPSAYQAALRSVTYADLSSNPNPLPRTLELLVTDGQSTSQPADRGISIMATNDPPSIMSPPARTVLAGMMLTFGTTLGDAIVVSDVDANGAAEQVTLTASDGRLTLAASAGLKFTAGTGAGDATMAFTGMLDRINAALDGLTFAPDANYAGSASLLVSIDDLGNTGLGGPQIVNALVPITVTGNSGNTPSVVGSPTDTNVPPPASTPPTVGQPPSGGTSVPPLPEPLIGKVPLPVKFAAPTNASNAPTDAPMPPRVAASLPNESAAAEQSDGGIAAASNPGTTDADVPLQKALPVFYMPPPARPVDGATSMPNGRPAEPAWARQIQLKSVRLAPVVASNQFESDSRETVGFFAFAPIETRYAAHPRPHVSFSMSATDNDRDDVLLARNGELWGELDALHRRVTSDTALRVWAGTASVISIGASVAWFLWMSRAGSLLSGLMSAMPAWRVVDPLPVIDGLGQAAVMLKRNADDGIEKLLRDAA